MIIGVPNKDLKVPKLVIVNVPPEMSSGISLLSVSYTHLDVYKRQVLRLASGGYIGGGLYHSQNIEGALATLPGARIVCPSFADDARCV